MHLVDYICLLEKLAFIEQMLIDVTVRAVFMNTVHIAPFPYHSASIKLS